MVEYYGVWGIIYTKGDANTVIVNNDSRVSVDMLGYPMVYLACALVRYKNKGDILELPDDVVYALGGVAARYACRVDKLYICEVALLRLIAIEPPLLLETRCALAKRDDLCFDISNNQQSDNVKYNI